MKNYLTYDHEGDWLLWSKEPVKVEGIWMPPQTKKTPDIEQISDAAAAMLGGYTERQKVVVISYQSRGNYSDNLKVELVELLLETNLSAEQMNQMRRWLSGEE